MAKTTNNPESISREAIVAILAGETPARTWDPDTPKHGGNHVLLGEAVQYALDPDNWRSRRLRWYEAQERVGLYGAEAAGGYRGYWLLGWLMDLRTARLNGHEDVATAALSAIRSRIYLETLCQSSAGRSIVPGSRTGDPWRGKINDRIRRALRDGLPLPSPNDRFWRSEESLGASVLLDIIARKLLSELPLGANSRYHPRLRWPMTVSIYDRGFVAEIPLFSGRIEGAPCWSVTVVGDEVVDVVDWRIDPRYEGASHNRIFHSSHVDARAPRPPLIPESIGSLRRTVRLGPTIPMPAPPLPKPPPSQKPEPSGPPQPPGRPPTRPEPPELADSPDFPPNGLHIVAPDRLGRKAVLRLLPGGRWEFVRWA